MSNEPIGEKFASMSQINIGKNDNMKKKISEILSHLNQSHAILISSRSAGIGKAVSIVEIAKQQFALQNDASSKQNLLQFNKMIQIDEAIKPVVLDDMETVVAQEITGKLTRKAAMLYVLLSTSPLDMDLSGWTVQSEK